MQIRLSRNKPAIWTPSMTMPLLTPSFPLVWVVRVKRYMPETGQVKWCWLVSYPAPTLTSTFSYGNLSWFWRVNLKGAVTLNATGVSERKYHTLENLGCFGHLLYFFHCVEFKGVSLISTYVRVGTLLVNFLPIYVFLLGL